MWIPLPFEVQVKFVPLICFFAALSFPPQSTLAQENVAKPITADTAADGGTPQQQSIPPNYTPASPVNYVSTVGSPYIPMDSWVYPALSRLQGLGYLDTAFLGLRPWTRLSVLHMLQRTADKIDADTNNDEAREIYLSVLHEVAPGLENNYGRNTARVEFESAYTILRGISGTPLRDSFHLGQTIINDYGRPYEEGFNNYTGFSAHSELGRFALYFRGEYQHAPSATGYSPALFAYLSNLDLQIPIASNPQQDTIPLGPIATTNTFRVMEATLSYHILNHDISFGKSDHWWAPNQSSSFAWSTNAENIYAFQIDRSEPLRIPLLSRLTGPFRYDFFVGSLKGHSYPNSPWVHAEKISFKPTENLELGFERTAIWGGAGHVPITIHTFLKSFFSIQNVSAAEKLSREDPGARFGTFDFSYRLPYLRKWLTLYTDSLAHDDVSPVSAPRRSAYMPGLYLSHFPGLEKLDLRVEGGTTDTVSTGGPNFLYNETIQKQGYTNKGFIMGSWLGRQATGGQAWMTWHLSPQEQIQFSYRTAKTPQAFRAADGTSRGFMAGGTTQNDYQFNVVKRIHKDIELNGWLQYERWVAPIYKAGVQNDTTVNFQITWFPHEQKVF
jgi:Capsule assembly protein Wzi